MSYKALYRKWRPDVFEDVIGQDQIVTMLKNQIKASNIAHAYLFTGTRGTGKTSTAKIFARAVNCIEPVDADPCNSCEVCRGILTENIMDVIEIDAASNNGVDNIREIRENVKYPPSKGKYKIYIIDEVHMLSTSAFNALLKTLEEPPSFVIFILATTEPHKIPATILSRCQRFDFRPIKIKDIMGSLAHICEDMNIAPEEEALRLIALSSEGAMRDALSILEQCISFSEDNLKYEDVVNILGMVNYEFIFNIADKIAQTDTSSVLKLINQIVMEGKDISQLLKDLINHFRSILLVKMKVEIDELNSLPEERVEMLRKQAEQFSLNQLSSFIYTLSDLEAKLKYSAQPRALFEIGVVGLCSRELDDSLEGIIERVKRLEGSIVSRGTKVSSEVNINTEMKSRVSPQNPSISNVKEDKLINKDVSSRDVSSKEVSSKEFSVKEIATKELPIKEETFIEDKASNSDKPLDFGAIQKGWHGVLDELRKAKKASIQALLMEGNLADLKKNRLIVSFKDGFGFHREALDKEKTKELIEHIVDKVTGQKVMISFVMEDQLEIKAEPKVEINALEKLREVLPKEIHEMLEVIDE